MAVAPPAPPDRVLYFLSWLLALNSPVTEGDLEVDLPEFSAHTLEFWDYNHQA